MAYLGEMTIAAVIIFLVLLLPANYLLSFLLTREAPTKPRKDYQDISDS